MMICRRWKAVDDQPRSETLRLEANAKVEMQDRVVSSTNLAQSLEVTFFVAVRPL